MKHYNEHTLDLFAMGSEKVADQREEFEQHLKECSLCRDFYNEITQFYEIARERHNVFQEKYLPGKDLSLTAHPGVIVKSGPRAIVRSIRYLPAIAWNYFIRKPVRSTIGFAASFCSIYFLALQLNVFMDKNPAYLHYNSIREAIEVQNKENDKLWEIKLGPADLESVSSNYFEDTLINKDSKIIDLNDDGKNEVLTVNQFVSIGPEVKRNVLHIFDYKGGLILRKEFGEPFRYNNEQFPGIFYVQNLLVDNFTNSGNKEILLGCNNMHSPFYLVRLDNRGNTIGEYWHYGFFFRMFLLDLNNTGRKELFLIGSEDVDKKAIIVVLEPSKITGKTEATQNMEFGLNPSKAEKFYIQLPDPRETSFLGQDARPRVYQLYSSSNEISFLWEMNYISRENYRKYYFSLFYYFSKDMKPLYIKPTDLSDLFYSTILSEGRIKKMPDAKYFEELKNQIQYWDGKEWRKEWCEVNSVIVP